MNAILLEDNFTSFVGLCAFIGKTFNL